MFSFTRRQVVEIKNSEGANDESKEALLEGVKREELQERLVNIFGEDGGKLLSGSSQGEVGLESEFRFQDIGAAPVRCRSSVVRVVFMKLGGIGLAAALTAGAHPGRQDIVESCAWAAAVNFIACVNYWFIWSVRAQSFSVGPYSKWMVKTGYNGAKDRASEELHAKLYAQEMAVDSFRHTDWTVTLPLMFLDLHKLAEDVSLEQPPLVTREVGAFFQTWIILLGSVGRFFVNEMRPDNNGKRPQTYWKFGVGMFSYLSSCAIFAICVYNLMAQVGWEIIDASDGCLPKLYKSRDQIAIHVIMWTQLGYPLATFVSVVWLNLFARDLRKGRAKERMPGNQYSPWLSTLKDMAYSSLDITSKGGLAFYCVLRVSYLSKVPWSLSDYDVNGAPFADGAAALENCPSA